MTSTTLDAAARGGTAERRRSRALSLPPARARGAPRAGRNDGRVGASAVMAAVQKVGRAATVNGTTVHDLDGRADALVAA